MKVATEQEKIEIINCLLSLDCCSRCIIRYIGVTGIGAYEDPENYLKSSFGDVIPDISTYFLPKKIKRNPCRVCLGIFQTATMERLIETSSSGNFEDYKYPDYRLNISFPKAITITNHSIFLYLKERFPHIYDNTKNIEILATICRAASSIFISKKLNKYIYLKSSLALTLEIEYEGDEAETKKMKNLNFPRKGNRMDTSKGTITAILENCEDELFKKHFSVPPEIPDKELYASIRCVPDPIWLGGRYLKFSRNVGQTPFIIDNKIIIEHSVQDFLFDSIEKILGFPQSQYTFSASGREDIDVRMLGNGRPFFIQIDNPKHISITFEQLRAIEREILKSKLVAVIKLQMVRKEDLKRIKDGEEYKRKHYYALCHTNAVNMDSLLKLVNDYAAPLEILQKTPLRVLHRRTQAVRKKFIYSMDAKPVPDHPDLFEIEIITQAGTYVKEFVTGEFERTTPSLTSILQQPVDIIALDVIRVELVWPELE